jgi:hypothetical protein
VREQLLALSQLHDRYKWEGRETRLTSSTARSSAYTSCPTYNLINEASAARVKSGISLVTVEEGESETNRGMAP